MAKTEEFKVDGKQVIQKVKELIKEHNFRSITIKSKDGKETSSFPSTCWSTF